MADIWDGAKPWVFQCGEARKDLFRTMGVSFTREAMRPAARAGEATMAVTDTWQALPTVKEVPVCFEEWDLEGFFWGRPGHFPLWVVIGDVSTRSAAGVLQKQVKDAKKHLWRTGLRQQNWPWWIWHESERSYWLPGDFSVGAVGVAIGGATLLRNLGRSKQSGKMLGGLRCTVTRRTGNRCGAPSG